MRGRHETNHQSSHSAGGCRHCLRPIRAGDAEVPSRSGLAEDSEQLAVWNPIGRWLNFPSGRKEEIIGVVKDSKYRRLNEETRPAIYRPFAQQYIANLSLDARPAGEPEALIAAVRREVQTFDTNMPLFKVKTLEEQKNSSLYTSRMAATLLTVFRLFALALAAVGLYGVMANAVNRRRREISIRLSLGSIGDLILTKDLHRVEE